jgi:hypothetical protein
MCIIFNNRHLIRTKKFYKIKEKERQGKGKIWLNELNELHLVKCN